MAAAARSGQQEIFQALVAAEQQQANSEAPTLLMAAVMEDQLEVVQALIAAGIDVNAKYEQFFEFNALYFALKRENPAMVRTLLAAGANPGNEQQAPMSSPIFKAIEQSNTQLVSLLLEYGASVTFERKFSLLVKAAEQNNPEIIKLLLNAGCDINETDYNDHSALRQACASCNVEVIKILINAGATLSASGEEITVPFYAPFINWQISRLIEERPDPTAQILPTLQALIEADANLDAQAHGVTALTLAITTGYVDVVKLLLSAGASPDLRAKGGGLMTVENDEQLSRLSTYPQPTTPLHLAAICGATEMAQLLIEAGADIHAQDEQGNRAVDIAIKEGHQDLVELLNQAGANASTEQMQQSGDALLGAAKQGNLQMLQSALAAGVDPNTSEPPTRRKRRKTALMFAAGGGHLGVVKALLAGGADVNLSDRPGKKLGKTPLMCAAENDHAEVIQTLVAAGAIVDAQDKRGQTALLYAVMEESAQAVEVLLELGADPHKPSWDDTPFENSTYMGKNIAQLFVRAEKGKTNAISQAAQEEMLRSAAFDGNVELVQELIDQGIDVNAPEPDGGSTALMYATGDDHIAIVHLLLTAGADVNIVNTSGETALSKAVYWSNEDMVKLLIAAGADLEAVEYKTGWTPIFQSMAMGGGNPEILQLLLDAGADATVQDNRGLTLLSYALEGENTEFIKLLHKAGILE
ncbi:MAG: ankyrin repeat domain-containing protein [Spirulinaceae cyanobacterium]